jgi:RNA polymerase sigma factor (sigma-70 family)
MSSARDRDAIKSARRSQSVVRHPGTVTHDIERAAHYCSAIRMATRTGQPGGAGTHGRQVGGIHRQPTGDAAEIAELVCRARTGDRSAMTQIVDRCTPMLRGVAHRYVSNPTDIDDVVQDTLVSLIEHLHSIKSPASTRAWLVRVTTHAAWRNQRKVAKARRDADLGDRAADDNTEELGLSHVWREQVRQPLADAMRELPPDNRRLIELLAADEPPDYRTASKMLHRPIGSIGPTRQRTLGRLRRQPALSRFLDERELTAAAH